MSINFSERMTPKEAGSYIGISEKTLAMMRCQDEGPPYIKTGRVYYFKEHLDKWLLEHMVIPKN